MSKSGETLAQFAQRQAPVLKTVFGMKTDEELASLSMIKLQEEAGEVAEAFLAARSLQRASKLNGLSQTDLLADLATELSDVIVVAALLAQSMGINIEHALEARLEELRSRRDKMLADHQTKQRQVELPGLPLEDAPYFQHTLFD